MLRFPLLLATVGLAIQCVLWSVPATLAVATLPHAIVADVPGIASLLSATRADTSARLGIRDALLGLMGAEVDALQVAGIALQPDPPADLGVRAYRSGARVRDAALTYARVFTSILDGVPNRQ